MIISYHIEGVPSATNYQSYGSYRAYVASAPGVTLEDLLECCEANGLLNTAILAKLNLRGFRNDKPTRKDLQTQMNAITIELSTIKRILQTISNGGQNGSR